MGLQRLIDAFRPKPKDFDADVPEVDLGATWDGKMRLRRAIEFTERQALGECGPVRPVLDLDAMGRP